MKVASLLLLVQVISACVYQGDIFLPLIMLTPSTAPCSPSIAFSFVPPYGSDEDLRGRAECINPDQYRVAVYIYVSGWWSKPTFQEPLTPLNTDGIWVTDVTTGGLDHQATQFAAFLVRAEYSPPMASGEQTLPQELFDNAVAHTIDGRTPLAREVHFSGYTWRVKDSESFTVGPGPNYFADDEDKVWVDEKGLLHLTITNQDNRWYATEVIASESFGYGTYTFTLAGRADQMDKNVVLGLFTWDEAAPEYNYREIDIEFGTWGEEAGLNAQYVVQPWDSPGNRYRFDAQLQEGRSTHGFAWQPDRVQFTSTDNDGNITESWVYTGTSIPPAGSENPRINLWLLAGVPPSNGDEVEIVIEAFSFTPFTSPGGFATPSPAPSEVSPVPPPPTIPAGWITVTAVGGEVSGEVGPPSVCNPNHKVALYAKTDNWYIQPFADSRRNITINADCSWRSSTHAWNQLAAFLMSATEDLPEIILHSIACPPSPLDLAVYTSVLATACFP